MRSADFLTVLLGIATTFLLCAQGQFPGGFPNFGSRRNSYSSPLELFDRPVQGDWYQATPQRINTNNPSHPDLFFAPPGSNQQSPFSNQQSQRPNQQSPFPSPQSQRRNQQSPFPNQQSLFPNRQSQRPSQQSRFPYLFPSQQSYQGMPMQQTNQRNSMFPSWQPEPVSQGNEGLPWSPMQRQHQQHQPLHMPVQAPLQPIQTHTPNSDDDESRMRPWFWNRPSAPSSPDVSAPVNNNETSRFQNSSVTIWSSSRSNPNGNQTVVQRNETTMMSNGTANLPSFTIFGYSINGSSFMPKSHRPNYRIVQMTPRDDQPVLEPQQPVMEVPQFAPIDTMPEVVPMMETPPEEEPVMEVPDFAEIDMSNAIRAVPVRTFENSAGGFRGVVYGMPYEEDADPYMTDRTQPHQPLDSYFPSRMQPVQPFDSYVTSRVQPVQPLDPYLTSRRQPVQPLDPYLTSRVHQPQPSQLSYNILPSYARRYRFF